MPMAYRLRATQIPEEPPAPLRAVPTPTEPPPVRRRTLAWWVTAAVLLLVLAIVSRSFDEFLRRTLETKINQRLNGYSVTLGGAHLSPFSLAVTLQNTVIRQQAHPVPPVASLPGLTAGVSWRELLRLHLVADAEFDRPRIHVNLIQLRAEDRDRMDVQDRGWQDALQSIYPLKFNLVQIRDGEIIYIDEDPERPLHITHWNLTAENIRNSRSAPGVYPSPVRTSGIVFGTGRALLTGHADFLAKPYPGIHAVYRVQRVPLDRLRPISSRANLELHGGVLHSHGEFEVGPKNREARIDDVTIQALRLDYLHTSTAAEDARAAKVARAAQEDQPALPVHVRRLQLTDSIVGVANRAAERPYRLFVDQADLVVTNISSGFREGPAEARLTGRFMGSGKARATGTFREEGNGPDFDLNIAIEGAQLKSINDLLRTSAKLDVTKGTFSVFSEVRVKDRRINGYVKPLFADVEVYDPGQDKEKPVLKKLYEKVAEGLADILENRPRDEVATVADLSGPLDDPNTSLWEIVVRLVSNAFVKAILPGFEREVEAGRRGG